MFPYSATVLQNAIYLR